jgi:hypothetical protein
MGAKSDNRADMCVAALAAKEWSVLSTAELHRCGLSSREIAARVRRGYLHRLHQGVYAVGHPNVGLEGQFLAAVKACGPGAVLSHFSAGALWELVEWDDLRYPEVTVCDTTPRVHSGIKVHRTRVLDPRDTRHHKGIPVTSPTRTVLDLCSQLPYVLARRAVRHALFLKLLRVDDLVEILERQRYRPGARRLRRIVATGVVPTQTVLEDVVLDLILEAGFERPDVNVPLILDGRRIVPDFRWPDRRLVVEADGGAAHANELAREDDAERQAMLEACGDEVMRVCWRQALDRRAQTVARLRMARRRTAPAPRLSD